MIKDTRRQHIRSLVLLAAASFGIGWLLGYRWFGLSVFLIGYMIWTLWQQNRLFNWLKDPRFAGSDTVEDAADFLPVEIVRHVEHEGARPVAGDGKIKIALSGGESVRSSVYL